MKYILKKDLPWMKAGTVFWFNGDTMKTEGKTLLAECYETTRNFFFVEDDAFSEANFEDNEWVEKVKPREWYEIVFGTQLNQRIRFDTLREAMEHNHKHFEFNNHKIVKVREVEED